MKATKSIPIEGPEQMLKAALAADPDVATAMAALQMSVERFNTIRDKLNDGTIETAATAREAVARAALVRAQALCEIGTATAEDVSAAREEHQAAREALHGITGRDDVLVEELRKAQAEVPDRRDALVEAFAGWRDTALLAVDAAAAEGVRLLQLAAIARDLVNGERGGAPRHTNDVAEWLMYNNVSFAPQPVPSVADAASETVRLLNRSSSVQSEEIRVPRRSPPAASSPIATVADGRIEPEYNTFGRPLIEKFSEADREKFASQPDIVPPGVSVFRSPGIPASLTHDPLGNPLPEARALLARKAPQSAPYEDGRGGAEEVA